MKLPMGSFETGGLIILALNLALSFIAFNQDRFFDALSFDMSQLGKGQWYRMITSAFIHVDWSHLFFNMFSLYIFAGVVEISLGLSLFFVVYFVSLLGGNMLSYWVHRSHKSYRSVGASGAVSGIIFSAIALYPEMKLSLIFLPIPFPAWVFAIGYILYSLYGMRTNRDNIGHEAHLGGAISGLVATLAFVPSLVQTNPLTIVYILVPAAVLLILNLVAPSWWKGRSQRMNSSSSPDDAYLEKRAHLQNELNRILDKANQYGVDALSQEEKEFLNRYG